MPKVPLAVGQVADPFNTKDKNKVQDRMPQGTSHLPNPNQPSAAELLMAAAAMHQMGKFNGEAP